MSSKREQILAQVKTILDATDGVDGRVYRSRAQALRKESTPGVLIEPVQEPHDYPQISTMDSIHQFRVSVVTRGDIPDQLADPIMVSIHALLMADRDLGGLAMDLYPTITNWTLLEGDGAVGVTSTIWAAKYRTQADSLES